MRLSFEHFSYLCETPRGRLLELTLFQLYDLLDKVKANGGTIPEWCNQPLHQLLLIQITVEEFYNQCFPLNLRAANDH